MPGGGACYDDNGGYGNGTGNGNFPGVDLRALCCTPYGPESREKELPDGTSVKWYSLCGFWGTCFRAGHKVTNAVDLEEGQLCGDIANVAEVQAPPVVEVVSPVGLLASYVPAGGDGGSFTRLRSAGII